MPRNFDFKDFLEVVARYGRLVLPIREVAAASDKVQVGDCILDVTYTATGTVALELPSAGQVDGWFLLIKDAASSNGAETYNITLSTEGSETIDGAATFVMNVNGEAICLYSRGGNWRVW